MKIRPERTKRESGFAIIIVVLVLAALLVLCTPFLLNSRNAEKASAHQMNRTTSRIALDTASNHGRVQLSGSHPAAIDGPAGFEPVDRTPFYDSLDEVTVTNEFEADFYNANDSHGVMWDLDVTDLSGKVDMNSAPPQMFANIMGLYSRLPRKIDDKERNIAPSPRNRLEVPVVLWIGGEYIYAEEGEGRGFGDVVRGIGAQTNADDEPLPGPRSPSGHGAGAVVLDQRAFGPVLWRLSDLDGELKHFDAPEQLAEASQYCWITALTGIPGMRPEDATRLREHCSVFAGVGGGRTWQRAARLTSPIVGGETGAISVDSPRWFNEGSTIQVTDGFNSEFAIVQRLIGGSQIEFDRPLVNDYEAYEAEVRVLARRPVNINSASEDLLILLFQNLQIRNQNDRIVRSEAETLAQVVMESRPIKGHEDFLRRIVLPAAGLEKLPPDAQPVPEIFDEPGDELPQPFITPVDALALYANSLNANDARLYFSTMPFCYSSRDTYELSMRSTVNAKSGVARAEAMREEVHHVVPQQELFRIWALQEHFDDSLRLDREAPFWATGPEATTRYDATTVPPSRLWPHMGTLNGQPFVFGLTQNSNTYTPEDAPRPEHVFAAREEQGFTQLWPYRVPETTRLQGRMEHFDQESRDPEGRYLPDESILFACDDNKVRWTDQNDVLARPLFFSLWIKPRSLENATLLDVGGTSQEVDRIALLIDNGNLVLRVFDGPGDHPDTALAEVGEVRYPLAQGEGPGLPVDTWSHIAIDVRGNRPDQMTMFVNGTVHGTQTPGQSPLAGSASQSQAPIPVESMEGFRGWGAVRIGDELMEYTSDGGALVAQRQETGRFAGFGGRNARVRWDFERPDEHPSGGLPNNLAFTDLNHEDGTSADQYGYSIPIVSNVPFGGSVLADELGPFRVARLAGIEGGMVDLGDPIIIQGTFDTFTVGHGLEGVSSATGLILSSADEPEGTDAEFMKAFNPGGGYAAIIQLNWFAGAENQTVTGAPLGGIEVIRYSGWNGTTLAIAARGDSVPELVNYSSYSDENFGLGGTRAFVSQWFDSIQFIGDDFPALTQMNKQAYVVPISVPAPGATDLNFLTASNGNSEFAQLTHVDDAELTEWVRYDAIEGSFGNLVRDGLDALLAAQRILVVAGEVGADDPTDDPGGGGGDTGGGGGGGGGQNMAGPSSPSMPLFSAGLVPEAVALAAPAHSASGPGPKAPASSASQSGGGADWLPTIGEDEIVDFPVSRAVSEAMQFRGVLGTYTHTHRPGIEVLPVFRLADRGPDGGQPGRLDPIFLVDGNAPYGHLGWPLTVHWAHRPAQQFIVHHYEQPDLSTMMPAAASQAPEEFAQLGFQTNQIFVALQSGSPEAMSRSVQAPPPQGQPPQPIADARKLTRMILFPSGEMPRVVAQASVGSGLGGDAIPSAVVDEIVFGDTLTIQTGEYPQEETRGACAVMSLDLAAGSTGTFEVFPQSFRTALSRLGTATEILSTYPEDAGLLRIGEEILCYDSRSTGTGVVTVAVNGRGLLGTEDSNHEIGEPVSFLEHFEVTTLTAGMGPGDGVIQVEDRTGFPQQATVLIGQELIHYTRVRGNSLEMPLLSEEPGMQDRGGGGVFRGRYGTEVQSHSAGEPVILFPFRYWDRWEELADGPELAYFGLSAEEPQAFWREMFFLHDAATAGGSRLGVLVRSDPDVPWDADPDDHAGLDVIYPQDLEEDWVKIGRQSDLVEWRVFVDYTQGAFDALTGQSHGWRQTPRLNALGVNFIAPNLVLRSVEE